MISKPLVTICMSTFNGSQFLEQQLDSIIEQSYTNWQLLAHDDGSKDQTVKILLKYEKQDNRIHFVRDNMHMGIIKSFFSLALKQSSDYYMFCDQDDIWKKDKIHIMLEKANEFDQTIPLLVHTKYQRIDGTNKPISESDEKELPKSSKFENLVLANNVTGCTCMFNNALFSLLDKNKTITDLNHIFMHDWWLAILASSLGNISFIEDVTVLYRQHSNNVVGAPQKVTLKKLIDKLTLKKKLKICKICEQALEFNKVYSNQISVYDASIATFLGDLLTKWIPHKQFIFALKHHLKMNTRINTFQFYVFTLLPPVLRKALF